MFLRTTAIVMGLLWCLAWPSTARSDANAWQVDNVPAVLPYQGRLEAAGEAVTGVLGMRFELVDAPDSTTPLWSETHAAVEVVAGRFVALLGESEPLLNVLQSGIDLYLKITIIDGGSEIPLTGAQRLLPSAYAVRPVSGGVPIGTVIDWYRPDASFPIPPGYMVADGRTVDDPSSPFHGKTLPDLVGKFVKGGTEAQIDGGPAPGGGSATHTHGVSIPNHTHAVSISHDHGAVSVTSGSDGGHSHVWARYNRDTKDWHDGQGGSVGSWSNGIDGEGSGIYPIYGGGGHITAYTNTESSHTHSVSVNLPNYSRTVTSGNGGSTSVTAGSGSSEPPWVGLLKLIRVR